MARVDVRNRRLDAKIVYYGCGLCGKTTNLEYINSHSKDTSELVAVSTEGDRTIFFDFLPMNLGKIRGIEAQFKLYAVPGQVRYNMTRKLVLKDVDGIVFVVDSQRTMLRANLASLENLYENLAEQGIDPDSIPIVLQYNKRDLDGVMKISELEKKVNTKGYSFCSGSALTGEGVFETLDKTCRLVFDSLWRSMGRDPQDVAGEPVDHGATDRDPVSSVANLAEELEPDLPDEDLGGVDDEPLVIEEEIDDSIQESTNTVDTTDLSDALPSLVATAERLELLVDQLHTGYAAGERPVAVGDDPALLASSSDVRDRESAELALREAEKRASEVEQKLLRTEQALEREKETNATVRSDLERTRTTLTELRATHLSTTTRILDLEGELRAKRAELEEAMRVAQEPRAEMAGESVSQPSGVEETQTQPGQEPTKSATKEAGPTETSRESSGADKTPPNGEAAPTPSAGTKAHQDAQRIARVMVSDLFLYHQDSIREGIRNGNIAELLEEPLSEARKTYEARVSDAVKQEKDHLAIELDRAIDELRKTLEAGDSKKDPVEEGQSSVPQASNDPPEQEEPPSSGEEAHSDDHDERPAEDNAVSSANAEQHTNAQRIAKVMISDLVLYHEEMIVEGIRDGNIRELLAEQLAEARNTFETRVPESVRQERDHLSIAFDEMIETRSSATLTAESSERPPETETTTPSTESAVAPDGVESGKGESSAPNGDPFADDREHQNARRIARVMVADLFLYHGDAVREGLRLGNVQEALEEQLGEARKTFEARVSESVRRERDYFAIEVDRLLEKQEGEAR